MDQLAHKLTRSEWTVLNRIVRAPRGFGALIAKSPVRDRLQALGLIAFGATGSSVTGRKRAWQATTSGLAAHSAWAEEKARRAAAARPDETDDAVTGEA